MSTCWAAATPRLVFKGPLRRFNSCLCPVERCLVVAISPSNEWSWVFWVGRFFLLSRETNWKQSHDNCTSNLSTCTKEATGDRMPHESLGWFSSIGFNCRDTCPWLGNPFPKFSTKSIPNRFIRCGIFEKVIRRTLERNPLKFWTESNMSSSDHPHSPRMVSSDTNSPSIVKSFSNSSLRTTSHSSIKAS